MLKQTLVLILLILALTLIILSRSTVQTVDTPYKSPVLAILS